MIEVYLLNKILYLLNWLDKTLKNTGKWRENIEKVGEICLSKNVGTMEWAIFNYDMLNTYPRCNFPAAWLACSVPTWKTTFGVVYQISPVNKHLSFLGHSSSYSDGLWLNKE